MQRLTEPHAPASPNGFPSLENDVLMAAGDRAAGSPAALDDGVTGDGEDLGEDEGDQGLPVLIKQQLQEPLQDLVVGSLLPAAHGIQQDILLLLHTMHDLEVTSGSEKADVDAELARLQQLVHIFQDRMSQVLGACLAVRL